MLRPYGKIGDYKIAFDGERLSDYFVVRGIDMPLHPTISVNEIEIDGKPGAWLAGRQVGTRDVTVRLGIVEPTSDRVRMFEDWVQRTWLLSKDGARRLDIGDGYYVKAVMTGSTGIEHSGRWSKVDVTFHCSDPFVYRHDHEIALASGENAFTVYGTYQAAPVIEIGGLSSTVDVENVGTGQIVRVHDIGKTNVLTVDMGGHACFVGGAYKPADPSVTDFWELAPGDCKVAVRTGSGVLRYTEKYL